MENNNVRCDIPVWLKFALKDEEWIRIQQAAWEEYLKPETFGRPPPQFVEISVENLKLGLFQSQLTKLCRRVVEHHRAAAKELVQAAEDYLRLQPPLDNPPQSK